MSQRFQDHSGVFGVLGRSDAATLVYLGLYGLQHRGQESAGIAAVTDNGRIVVEKEMGYVADVFTVDRLSKLAGDTAIGHVRYSTASGATLRDAQPIIAGARQEPIAVAFNGGVINREELCRELEAAGVRFTSTTNAELLAHLIARSCEPTLERRFVSALSQLRGGYAVVLMSPEMLLAARDPHGVRPLVLGRLGTAISVSSESCALDLIEGEILREVGAGEVIAIERYDGHPIVRTISDAKPVHEARCIFEHIYAARPDSIVFGKSVAETRQRLGTQLAIEHPVDADLVVPVPDSGLFAALGYASQSRIPFQLGFMRNHYVGRTFIEPLPADAKKPSLRYFGVKVKLSVIRELVIGKRVVLVDDSIIRGTTTRKVVSILRDAGAHEVHVRISSPPTMWPCRYGIDTPEQDAMIASSKPIAEICDFIGADSLGYLSVERLLEAMQEEEESRTLYCTACYTGIDRVDR